jgi:hypothetical protein
MAEPSLTQMQLVTSETFLRRVTYLSWEEAERVLAEPETIYGHDERLSLANAVLSSPERQAPTLALAICRSNGPGRVILGTVVENEDPALVDSSASDLAVASALTYYWNTVAHVPAETP